MAGANESVASANAAFARAGGNYGTLNSPVIYASWRVAFLSSLNGTSVTTANDDCPLIYWLTFTNAVRVAEC